MISRAGRYFGLPFKGYRGMTQGYPMSPTLFNVVVDTVIHHWVAVVVATKEGMEVLGMSIWYLAGYFYADNGLASLTQPERLQRAFEVLTVLFKRVVLRTNTWKTVGMACQPCHTPGRMSVEAYERRTAGTGTTFWERQRGRLQCPG